MTLPSMTLAAPFDHETAKGDASARALWTTANDGLRLRVAIWDGGAASKGTVLLFPGRTEYVEKYGLAAQDLAARGFGTISVDWRCQGLADRLLNNPMVGDVARFSDYQRDVAALLEVARAENLPEPWYMIAHSMGGAIGFRALADKLPVKAAVFTAPMWGIEMAPYLRPVSWVLSWLSRPLGFSHLVVPGTRQEAYVIAEPFAQNSLTADPAMYAYMQNQITAQPGLGLGGPSLRWLYESLRELRRQSREPSPAVPCLTFLGSAETVVQPGPIRARMAKWPNGTLQIIPDGRHEVMMETPAIRTEIFDQIAAHFSAYP